MVPSHSIKTPLTGLAVLAVLGPSIVWASEYIGSGEVILATRNGAIFGTGIIWVIISGILMAVVGFIVLIWNLVKGIKVLNIKI